MPESKVNYYFGRLNILASYKDKRKFILEGLRTKKIIEKRKFLWGFFDIQEIESEIGTIFYGNLVKYFPVKREKIVETQDHKLGEKSIENKVIGSSSFFIHVYSSLIAYHPKSGIINRNQFTKTFCEIFEEAYERMFVDIEIQSIDEQFKVIETLKKFSKILKIRISLHPSNPSNRDLWAKVDERLKKLHAGSYQEQISAKPNTKGLLNIEEDEDIKSKISMSEDGYGETRVDGIINNEKKTISTKDNPIRARAPRDEEDPKKVFNSLISTFKKLLKRFNK